MTLSQVLIDEIKKLNDLKKRVEIKKRKIQFIKWEILKENDKRGDR